MSQVPRGKSPLDVLQSMVNAILIETGKALRASNKESGKSLANVNIRLRSTIPSTIENFHKALDDLECDIVRAKSVLLRDLEEMRAKRKALENPAPIIEQADPNLENTNLSDWAMDHVVDESETQPSPQATIKQEDRKSRSPEKQAPSAPTQPPSIDPAKETISMVPGSSTGNGQGPTPPSSVDPKPIGLGISTESAAIESVLANTEPQDSSIESLFGPNDGGSDLVNFDGMDFMEHNDQSQPQNDDFDMANFGNTSPDFNITDAHTSTQASNPNNGGMNKQENDMFSMTNSQAADNMDLDFDLGIDTAFNDMYDTGNDLDHNLDSNFFDS